MRLWTISNARTKLFGNGTQSELLRLGAHATKELSAIYAERFRKMVGDDDLEPCYHANGNVGLFKHDASVYADIEFYADGKVVYYIERGAEKTKGFVSIGTPGRLVALLS